MNEQRKFDGRAEHYAKSRPSYAVELIDYLYNQYGLSQTSVTADIGSGTGKFSKQLLDRQSEVYCVEPNDDMRHIAERDLDIYAKFHSVMGIAEQTTLKSSFVDFITSAQAFHWFDVQKFKEECLRIIKPCGKIFLIWNTRSYSDEINQEWHEIFSRFCPCYKGFSNGIERNDPKIIFFFDKKYDYVSFDFPLIFKRDDFIKRSLSSSYSLKENDKNYNRYISALDELFYRHEKNGTITVPNRSLAYIGFIK